MVIDNQDNICSRCHTRTKFLEIFKQCFYCSTKHCNQCWLELQISDDYKLLIDLLPKKTNTNIKRICSTCIKILLSQTLNHSTRKKQENDNDDYQLALAISLSQNEADEKLKQKRKFNENKSIHIDKINQIVKIEFNDNHENLLEKITEAIERFMNRAKSNYQRNRDVIGDTALLSAFISLQTCATDLEKLKHDLDDQRQHFETLQEKLTALRDAREALNMLRYEHHQKKRQEQERLEQQRRLLMIQKVADLRQFKHTQIANFQENYFQHLLDEEQKMKEHLKKQKLFKDEQFNLSQLPDHIKDYISKLQNENNQYTNELQSLQTQLNNLTAVVDFADSTKIAEIADLKQRHQQELATINILMEETVRDRVDDMREKYDNELNILRRKFELLQQENYELRSKVTDEKDSVIATISRSLRDKLTLNQPSIAQENENLEEDMRKAQESTLMLKSVIIPLEAEIAQLKSLLNQAKDKITELEELVSVF
ncbi:unnamed protein product [Rotaria sp. Silwood1]|nr:unnamed protein product [Rotaria sp. Silwood1]CAF3422494.1 unnamed protein product [Rotaria sp. Silwood1]CAF3429872.1 unnamed protein product [Rotaria sp. Silwood1]CAF3434237.1 unnamed protein product [Rotaria sp. Silwood1]CAF4549862.1 unnamed protein product [Rotaria sp. Silwood1]